jgi:hypothetical protein
MDEEEAKMGWFDNFVGVGADARPAGNSAFASIGGLFQSRADGMSRASDSVRGWDN